MRFFDRTEEIASSQDSRNGQNNAQFTVVTGRRRIGKTSLVWKAYEDEPILFLCCPKAEGDLCEDYRLEIENKLGSQPWGGPNTSLMCSST